MAVSRGYCSRQFKKFLEQASTSSSANGVTWKSTFPLFSSSGNVSRLKTCHPVDFFIIRRAHLDCKANSTVKNKISSQNVKNLQHRSDHVTKARYSTCGNDGVLPSESQSHHEITTSTVSFQISSMLQCQLNMDNCNTAEALVHFVDQEIKKNSLHVNQITAVTLLFQKLVFASLPLDYLSENFHFRTNQIESTTSALQRVKELTSDSRWECFMSSIMQALENNTISLTDQATLLGCLSSLFVSDESEIMHILLDKCLENISLFSLKDLMLVSDVCSQCEPQFVMKGKILSTIHDKMKHCHVNEIDLSNICRALRNVQPVIGEETVQLLADLVKRKLTQDVSSLTPGCLLMAYQLMTSQGLPYFLDLELESKIDMIAGEIPETSLTDLPAMDLNLVPHLSELPWPISNLLGKVQEFCSAQLYSSSENFHKYPFTLLSYCLQGLDAEHLHPVITQADAFLLLKLIEHHTIAGLTARATTLAYHDRLLQFLPELTQVLEDSQHCRKIYRVLYTFLRHLRKFNIQPDDSLLKAVYKCKADSFDPSSIRVDTPKSELEIFFEQATKTLKSNSLLSFSELATLTCNLSRLDTGGMLKLYQSLDDIFDQAQPDVKVKNQIQKLKASLQELFSDRLTRAVDLPTSLIRMVTRKPMTTIQPGLFEHLLNHLPRFVFTGDKRERNCLGALAVLSFLSGFCPMYHEDLLEELTRFVAIERPNSPTPALQLLRALGSAGYLPQDFDLLTAWLWPLISRLVKTETVDKSFLVEIAFNMSDLGLFHDELLNNIFNLSFLSGLHSELTDKPDPVKSCVHECLVWLSRSVAIECPHLTVPYLSQSKECPRQMSRLEFLYQQKLLGSLRRICPDDEQAIQLVAPSQSPYGHHIDAELILNLNALTANSFNKNQKDSLELICQRVAVLYGSKQDFCVGSNQDVLRGLNQAVIRQLQILGYIVVNVSQNELSSMEIHNQQAEDDLVKEKIKSVLSIQVFSSD